MGLFKKLRRIVHPASRLFDKRGDGGKGYQALGENQAHSADLDAAMKDYGNIESNIRDTYTNAAKKAGTYADTDEFKSGLNSEIQAGVRGARANAVQRINALRKAMGNNEEFKPEGYDQTQGNTTADKLAAAPAQEEAPAAPEADTATAAPQTNAAASIQNTANPLQARLASLRSKLTSGISGRPRKIF